MPLSELTFTPDRLENACAVRRPGFCPAVKAVGTFTDGVWHIPAPEWHRLTIEFLPRPSPGLGDLVASVATPIARALGLPCIDPATNQLRPDSGCAQRRAALNRLTE